MKYVQSVPRWLLGLIYFVFGLNGFFMAFGMNSLVFIPMPPPDQQPPGAAAFGAAMFATGYFFQLLKVTEVTCSLLLLTNKWVPLALIVLAPITLNIAFFHLFLTPGVSQLILPLFMVALHVYLGRQNWNSFKPLFK